MSALGVGAAAWLSGAPVSVSVTGVWLLSMVAFVVVRQSFFTALLWLSVSGWTAVGFINVWVVQALWVGWSGDTASTALIFGLYGLGIALTGLVLPGHVSPHGDVPESEVSMSRLTFWVLGLATVAFALAKLQAAGWTGVFGGALNDSNRTEQTTIPLIGRLAVALPMLAALRTRTALLGGGFSLFDRLAFIAAAYVTLSGGSRWGFLQLVASIACAAIVVAGTLPSLRVVRRDLATATVLVLIALPVVSALRSTNDQSPVRSGTVIGALSSVGGEFRDAAYALANLGAFERELVKDGFWRQLISPVVPGPLKPAMSMAQAQIEHTAAHRIVQASYGVDMAIRVGIVTEVALAFGLGWCLLLGLAVGFVTRHLELRARSRSGWWLVSFAVAFPSLSFVPAGQSDALLAPIAAALSLILLVEAIQWTASRSTVRHSRSGG